MPRPSRYHERETGEEADPAADAHRTVIRGDVGGGKEGKVETKPDPSQDTGPPLRRKTGTVGLSRPDPEERGDVSLDDRVNHRQSSTVIKAGEAELEVARSVARRMGWVPQDEWKRDPTKWVDATDFLERTPAQVENLRDRARRAMQVEGEILEATRAQGRQQAEAEVRAATKAGDEDAAVRASEKLATYTGPDTRSVVWAEKNQWFKTDPTAAAVAEAAALKSKRTGGSFDEQLEAAENEVRRRFPEHFLDSQEERNQPERRVDREVQDEPRGREVRMSEVVRRPPSVEGGNRSAGARDVRPRDKGWGDLSSAIRDQMGKQVRAFEGMGLTADQARNRLARAYFREQDQ